MCKVSVVHIEGCGSPVVKALDHGRHVMSSSPIPLKTRRVGQRCTLKLSRAETSCRWCGVEVRREGASSGVIHVTRPWPKITWSVTKSPRVAEQFDKLLGRVDTRRYPRAENRVWIDQEDHEERGSNDRTASTCGPPVTRSTIRVDVGVAIVPQTISRHLAEANLKSKCPFRALPLTPEHRQLRLQWCQARSMWNVTDWQKVVFSDESRFVLGTDDNRVRKWRRPSERYNSPHTVLRHTARTAGVMVWGP
ncbi:transposable element Tcb2 transposase [Trichonephila clavipes]|nr:transposable element Tcb2 transposase [Trichonephila clavipes]